MRLTDARTRAESGFDYVLQSLDIKTPFGRKEKAAVSAFAPGEEDALEAVLQDLQQIVDLILSERKRRTIDDLLDILAEIKDVTFSVKRSAEHTLSVVELFEIKCLLLQLKRLRDILIGTGQYIPPKWMLSDLRALLDALDPRGDRLNTFYLYDEFSKALAGYRVQKHALEKELRREQKRVRQMLAQEHGLALTPKFDLVIAKSNSRLLEQAEGLAELVKTEEDYMSATFVIKSNETMHQMQKEAETIQEQIEAEEEQVREAISRTVGIHAKALLEDCERVGRLDFTLAKARYAVQNHCSRPQVIAEHRIRFEAGRQLEVEQALREKNLAYCPVDMALKRGVTCITGANMGGKTISLKLIALVALLAQHGFFVPCAEAELGLSSYVHILVGDSQSAQRGLSSFGGEMEELKDSLDHSSERSLLLIDEIASGTNPMEGLALICGLIEYLLSRTYIAVLSTHLDHAADDDRVVNMQVRGLADADFHKLEKELRYANRKERISIIAKYMDYRLYTVQRKKEIPKDALNIAQMLGVYPEIIEYAKKHLGRV